MEYLSSMHAEGVEEHDKIASPLGLGAKVVVETNYWLSRPQNVWTFRGRKGVKMMSLLYPLPFEGDQPALLVLVTSP